MSSKDELTDALDKLVEEGGGLFEAALKVESAEVLQLGSSYQQWYSKALRVLEVLGPDRLVEFRSFYERDSKRKVVDALTYSLQDFFQGIGAPTRLMEAPRFDIKQAASLKILNQQQILRSVGSRIDGIFANLEATIASSFYERELEGARALLKINLRAAGVLAGVVLEEHLQAVVRGHGVKLKKRKPGLADLNDALKDAGVYGVPQWRKIQYMADVRNLAAHKKDREPTKEEVEELISGTDAATKKIS